MSRSTRRCLSESAQASAEPIWTSNPVCPSTTASEMPADVRRDDRKSRASPRARSSESSRIVSSTRTPGRAREDRRRRGGDRGSRRDPAGRVRRPTAGRSASSGPSPTSCNRKSRSRSCASACRSVSWSFGASKRATEMMSGGSRSAHASNSVGDVRNAVVNRHPRSPTADPRSVPDRILVVGNRHDRPGKMREHALERGVRGATAARALLRERPAVRRVGRGYAERAGSQSPERARFRRVRRHHSRAERGQLASQGEVRT